MRTLPKSAVAVLVLILGWSFKGPAQTGPYVTLHSNPATNSVNYALQTNQIVSLAGYDWNYRPVLVGNFADGTPININPSPGTPVPHTIVTGLTNITFISEGQGLSAFPWATLEIRTATSPTIVSNYVPADAVVIPSNATGNVQIILESSPDLVNWTAASPGIYAASSATNRFFRVRAVVTP